jgi:hypothetical protein
MSITKFVSRLRKSNLFNDFSEDQLNKLVSEVKELSFAEGEYLVHEGERGTDFFFIESGEVEITKINPSNGEETSIRIIGSGEIVGELAFIKGGEREASVKAVSPTRVLSISIRSLKNELLYLEIKSRLSDVLTERLKDENRIVVEGIAANLEHTKARLGLGNLLVHLIALIFLYIYAIRVLAILKIQVLSTTFISIPVLALFALSMFILIKSNGYPLSLYGFTWRGKIRVVVESILYCIPVFAIIVATKWVAINLIPGFSDLKFFHISPASADGAAPVSSITFSILVLLYALFVPIQEFIFRGAIQSSLEQFLLGKHRTLQAILISNLPFSMIHLHLSFSLTILVYFFGVFWGWMYARQRTLIGCCINHFFVGLWAFFIVGIQDFLVV